MFDDYKIQIDRDRRIGKIDPNIYGHFIEHMSRCIYGGIYDPESPAADEDGFRSDVVEAVRDLNPGIIRWPGGNYASAYHWKKGVGLKPDRPTVYDPVWFNEESNQFGTWEFIRFCRKVNAEPYICLNMGTGSIDEAMAWVEYCNSDGNGEYANLRRKHGSPKPFGVKYWGLGNEVYGRWQMGHKSANEYARQAVEFAKAIRWVDPSIKIIAAGAHASVDDPAWDMEVLRKAKILYPVGNSLRSLYDYISIHGYCSWATNNYYHIMAAPSFMEERTKLLRCAIAVALDRAEPDHDIKIAWDEWNLWSWLHYEKHLENDKNEQYTLENALFTASVLNSFQRNCDIVAMANYSPSVNIRGAIYTYPEGIVLRPQYHVLKLYSQLGGNIAFDVKVTSDGFDVELPVKGRSPVPLLDVKHLDVAATLDEDNNRLCIAVVNKHPRKKIKAKLLLSGFKVGQGASYRIYHDDVKAFNDVDHPNTIAAEIDQSISIKNEDSLIFFPHSVTLIILNLED